MIGYFSPGHAIINASRSLKVIGRIWHSALLSPRRGLIGGKVVLVDVQ